MLSILIFIVLLILAYSVYVYNKFIRTGNIVEEAWSDIEVELKRRHDLIPNLVEIVKGYSSHENETLKEIVKLRSESQALSSTLDKTQVEQSISRDLKKIIALAEAYPDLKADKNFRSLQTTLTEVEDNLQYARRYYNGSVRNYNILIDSIPSNIIASICNFKSHDFFEIEYATERQAPELEFSN